MQHKPVYEEKTQVKDHFPTLKEIIRNKIGLFSNKIYALPTLLPKDIIDYIGITCDEIFVNISKLINDRNLLIPENKLRKVHELSCITNHEQDFFNLLAKSYQTEISHQKDYALSYAQIPGQNLLISRVIYNRNRHLAIDKYLHKNFGVSGFVTDIFIQALGGPQAPLDKFEILIKIFCIKIIYEDNRINAKIHFINNLLKQKNPNYPDGIFKEVNTKLFIQADIQWIDIDDLIELIIHNLSLAPVPIEGFPNSAEGYREKGFTWARNRLTWPTALNKYLFDEPPGLNDDAFTYGLEEETTDNLKQISPGFP